MKKRYLVGNLKMNLNAVADVERYLVSMRKETSDRSDDSVEIVVAAPSIYLERFSLGLPEGVVPAAQDVFWEKEGSYTGQVSVPMLRDLGVGYVIVGHSERRAYAHETDEEIGRKVRAVLHGNLRPILCVGETAEERDGGRATETIANQVRSAFRDIPPLSAERVLVAYEPRWAIGGDTTPETEDIFGMSTVIRRTLSEAYGAAVADRIPVLYGGSVKEALLDRVCLAPKMDGVLVGRESLYPHEFSKMAGVLSRDGSSLETGM